MFSVNTTGTTVLGQVKFFWSISFVSFRNIVKVATLGTL